jgi:hypothetical protein
MTWRPIIGADGEEYWVDDAELPTSPAAMRGSGVDTRLAANGDSPGVTQPLPYGNVVQRVSDWASQTFDARRAEDAARPTMGQRVAGADAAASAPTPSAEPGAAAADAIIQGAGGGQPAQSGPEYLVKPGTPGGMRTTSIQTQGIAPEDKAAAKEAFGAFEREEIDLAQLTERIGEIRASRQEATGKQQAQRAAIKRDTERGNTAALEKQVNDAKVELDGALKRDYNPGRLWGNPWFAISAAIGGLAGELLTLRGKRDPKQQMQFWQNINGMVDADIQNQIDTNRGLVAAAREKFGASSDSLAKSVALGRYWEDIANELDVAAQTAPDLTREQFQLEAARARATAKKNQADAIMAIADRRTTSQTYVAGTPATSVFIPDEKLKSMLGEPDLGKARERYQKALGVKAGSGENSPTAAQALENVKAIRADLAAYKALSDEGLLSPDKTVTGQVSEKARNALAYFGIDVNAPSAQRAEHARQILKENGLKYAKALGGAVTPADVTRTEEVMGQSVEANARFLGGLADDALNAAIAAVSYIEPARAQKIIDLQLGNVQRTPGVPRANLRPVGPVR